MLEFLPKVGSKLGGQSPKVFDSITISIRSLSKQSSSSTSTHTRTTATLKNKYEQDSQTKAKNLKLLVEYGMIQKFPGIYDLCTMKFLDKLTKYGNGFVQQFSHQWGSPFDQWNSQDLSLEPALADMPNVPQEWLEPKNLELEDKKSEGFVWGVPKKRRSLERRWCIKIGAENWVWKMLIPKYDIRICDTCGHHYQSKHLCRNCYERVREESKSIRKSIETKIGDNVEDKDVVILYQNEGENLDKEKLKDKLLVEIPKERPAWFSKNLLQKTTTVPDPDTTTVTVQKPNLG